MERKDGKEGQDIYVTGLRPRLEIRWFVRSLMPLQDGQSFVKGGWLASGEITIKEVVAVNLPWKWFTQVGLQYFADELPLILKGYVDEEIIQVGADSDLVSTKKQLLGHTQMDIGSL
ncbi:hypothetical protein T265_03457 [Opisthorchis viverrini]|uniref:Uncharacterized protein n=1 Tax=Opisthorchis viverrini TaxID=6198 RepID=A0A075AHL5_OPIVI|nr:hypothetical protein T265_03457 [Opisthorchis viverrini]KER30094.1 hypothetical protein T265_03457 [Opisthorchis viverrini]